METHVNHICLADDDADDQFLFSLALQELNRQIKLSEFKHCEELHHFLKTTNDLPNLIVLDMNMPGNDGLKCLKAIKQEAALGHIPVAILTTTCSPQVTELAYNLGAFTCVQKPNTIKELKNVIANLMSACNNN